MAADTMLAFRPMLSGLLVLASLTPLVGGCASFKASKRLDVGPFAENTVGMIGEVQRATKPVVWAYLKKYDQLASVQDVRRVGLPARTLMRGVAMYSTQLVSIYESNLSEAQKCRELALYLDQAVRHRIEINPVAAHFISQGGLDSAVTEVRASANFLGALGAAQPVVSAALAYGNFIYDSLDVEIDRAAADIDSRIEADFAPANEQMELLTNLQLRGTRAYGLLSRYRYGTDAALDTLRSIDPQSAESLPSGRRPTPAALEATEKRILAELEITTQLRAHLGEELDRYKAEQLELDQLRVQAREAARLGRITLILWARSHRNLAAGVTVPAAINVMGIVQSAAGKAAGVVVP